MSTDYGLKCRDCDERQIVENLRYSSALAVLRPLIEHAGKIAEFERATGFKAHDDDHDWLNWSLRAAKEFAVEHLGHHLVVVDEYGREWDQCHGDWVCPTCGHRENCALKENHEGDHRRNG